MATDSTCPNSICKYRNRVTGHCSYTGPCIETASVTSENIRSDGVKMPEGLTKMGYDMIVEHIINMKILEIIGKMKDQ